MHQMHPQLCQVVVETTVRADVEQLLAKNKGYRKVCHTGLLLCCQEHELTFLVLAHPYQVRKQSHFWHHDQTIDCTGQIRRLLVHFFPNSELSKLD